MYIDIGNIKSMLGEAWYKLICFFKSFGRTFDAYVYSSLDFSENHFMYIVSGKTMILTCASEIYNLF